MPLEELPGPQLELWSPKQKAQCLSFLLFFRPSSNYHRCG